MRPADTGRPGSVQRQRRHANRLRGRSSRGSGSPSQRASKSGRPVGGRPRRACCEGHSITGPHLNRKIFARTILGTPDADAEVITLRMNALFPGHACTAALYLVEHGYLTTPVTPLLDPSAISAWNQVLEGSTA